MRPGKLDGWGKLFRLGRSGLVAGAALPAKASMTASKGETYSVNSCVRGWNELRREEGMGKAAEGQAVFCLPF